MAMHSSSRNGATVIWLVLHTTEGIMRAWDLRNWTSWAGSSHAASDETGVLLTPEHGFVPYDRAAWTLRNGNPISENIEQCGWARWTRAEWLARPQLLDATARWLADRSKARGIPLRRLSHAEVRARVPGVIMHDDYSKATGDGSHWDCGPGYPWDVVLAKAVAYRDGAPAPDDVPEDIDMRVIQSKNRGSAVVGPGYFNELNAEELPVAIKLYGKPTVGNDREFDLAKAIAVQGLSSDRVEKHLTPPAA